MSYSELPRKIVVEKGAVNKIENVIGGLGPEFLVVVDPITKDIAGEAVRKNVGGKLFIISNSTLEEVKRLEAEKADCIISVGGGKVIDVGKLASHNKKIPFISIPTACSHDGIASRNASITVDGKSASFTATTPFAIIADLDILLKAPYRFSAAGAADVISNYTAVFDWRLAKDNGEEYREEAANLALLAADLVSNNTKQIKEKTEKGIYNLVWSLIYSSISMTLAGSSRPASGAEHLFSHALDSLGSKGVHGEQVGLGAIIFACLQGQNWKKIKTTLQELGCPTTAKELDLEQDLLIDALIKSKDIRERYTILNQKPLDKELALKVCKTTGVL